MHYTLFIECKYSTRRTCSAYNRYWEVDETLSNLIIVIPVWRLPVLKIILQMNTDMLKSCCCDTMLLLLSQPSQVIKIWWSVIYTTAYRVQLQMHIYCTCIEAVIMYVVTYDVCLLMSQWYTGTSLPHTSSSIRQTNRIKSNSMLSQTSANSFTKMIAKRARNCARSGCVKLIILHRAQDFTIQNR